MLIFNILDLFHNFKLQRYEKKASFWERLRILGTVAGTVAKDKCIKFIFHLISSV